MHSGNTVQYSISEFLKKSDAEILGELRDTDLQVQAWQNQINELRSVLQDIEGTIIFEYSIPGLSKVCDVVLLLNDKIFVLEYKNGADRFDKYAIEQTMGYALRIKYFQSESKNRDVVPILIATEVSNKNLPKYIKVKEDGVYNLVCTNKNFLRECLISFIGKSSTIQNWQLKWRDGIFKASPTIIEAAKEIWNKQNVQGLIDENTNTRSTKVRLSAETTIKRIIETSRQRKRKSLVFITGVPGAGKTLIGLRVSVTAQEYGASLLSGNGPLVEVLTTALRRNLDSHKEEINDDLKSKLNQKGIDKATLDKLKDKIAVDSIIRGVYAYKNEIIERLNYEAPIKSKDGKVLRYEMKKEAHRSSQHIVIYDEAQRAWSVNKMRKPGRRRKEWQTESWTFSEPALLLWDMDQLDWGVFICLVGGGQEINEGESGINEWLRCLCEDTDKVNLPDWDVYIGKNDDMKGREYALIDHNNYSFSDYLDYLRKYKPDLIKEEATLHLVECQRTPLSTQLSDFINKVIEGKANSSDYDPIKDYYTICLTRSVEDAKKYLRTRQRELSPLLKDFKTEEIVAERDAQLVRVGILMSSNGLRLRPLGFDIKKVGSYTKTSNWFLDTKEENIDSSDFLEVALDEFFVQGLEIDLSCVLWDADFRFDPIKNEWRYYTFKDRKWSEKVLVEEKGRSEKSIKDKKDKNIKTKISQTYMRNAYRVLLTRARLGMVICVPEGDKNDDTRDPKFYNSTFEYLKSLGLKII